MKLAEQLIFNDSFKSNFSCFFVQDPKANPQQNAILMPDISTWAKQHAFIMLASMFAGYEAEIEATYSNRSLQVLSAPSHNNGALNPPLWVTSVIL